MISINKKSFNIKHFPDNTQCLLNTPALQDDRKDIEFEWKYESHSELVTLQFLSKHYSEKYPNKAQILYMPYIPNARMDRVKSDLEVFTLKYFAEIINSLHFKKVIVLDPHSPSSLISINNIEVLDVYETCIKPIINDIFYVEKNLKHREDLIIYFPDEGAMKRYSDKIFEDLHCKFIYGEKIRDWNTGEIKELTIHNPFNIDLKDKIILMIDDIISYGGTLFYSVRELQKLNVGNIYAYATHTENSVLDVKLSKLLSLLESGEVQRLYTTNSLYNKKHNSIYAWHI